MRLFDGLKPGEPEFEFYAVRVGDMSFEDLYEEVLADDLESPDTFVYFEDTIEEWWDDFIEDAYV